MDEVARQALLRNLRAASFEIIPLEGVEEEVHHIPAGAELAISCSPEKGVQATLDLARQLSRRDFELIPHVAARGVANEEHLVDILGQLDELEISRLLVVGGDNEQPLGPFNSSPQLLEAMSDIDHGIAHIGVGAYPEGHPLIDDPTLLSFLQRRRPHAAFMVTQMCFDPGGIASWLRTMRHEGIELPVKIGIPGVSERAKLFRIALKIGVGQSSRFLKSNLKLIGKLATARRYSPDELVLDLGPAMADATLGISALHFYTFNQLDSTEEWFRGMIRALESESI